MYSEWLLVVTMLLVGDEQISLLANTYDNPLECISAQELLESAGALAECIETLSDKHPM